MTAISASYFRTLQVAEDEIRERNKNRGCRKMTGLYNVSYDSLEFIPYILYKVHFPTAPVSFSKNVTEQSHFHANGEGTGHPTFVPCNKIP